MVLSEVLPPKKKSKKNPNPVQFCLNYTLLDILWCVHGVYIYIYINNLLPFEDTQTNKKQNLLVPDPQLFLATLKVAPLGQI
jgi:hypothetical protein